MKINYEIHFKGAKLISLVQIRERPNKHTDRNWQGIHTFPQQRHKVHIQEKLQLLRAKSKSITTHDNNIKQYTSNVFLI